MVAAKKISSLYFLCDLSIIIFFSHLFILFKSSSYTMIFFSLFSLFPQNSPIGKVNWSIILFFCSWEPASWDNGQQSSLCNYHNILQFCDG